MFIDNFLRLFFFIGNKRQRKTSIKLNNKKNEKQLNAFASTYYQLQGAPQFNVAIVLLHTHILPFAMRK